MIEHHSVVNVWSTLSNAYRFQEHEVILQFANYIFDASVEQMTLALLNGFTLLVVPDKLWINPDKFIHYINENKVSYIEATPSLLKQYDFSAVSSLRRIIAGGEAVTIQLFNQIKKTYPGIDFINTYGPTEITITALFQFDGHQIGRPIWNTQAYVLDNYLRPVPMGAIGELYIGGVGLSRGYLNRTELTAERFINNPFQTTQEKQAQTNQRLYKTGDLVRWRPDGNIEYLGRNDFQVKIRGYRIELGEIEAAMLHFDGIIQSVVIAREHQGQQADSASKFLAAYFVAKHDIDQQHLLAYLAARLPEYMVPAVVVQLSEFPLTVNGKLDRKALPEPSFNLSSAFVPPRTELEQRVATIYAEVLGLSQESVGITDDFFRLGGNSILAIKLISRLNASLSVKINVPLLF
ncbi:MAG: non-ribosomal peptide synthetase, partial [bacterium]